MAAPGWRGSGRPSVRDASRWCIKSQTLEQQLRACEKSLAAARRSGRESVAQSLETKLADLKRRAGAADAETAPAAGRPRGEPGTALRSKAASERAARKSKGSEVARERGARKPKRSEAARKPKRSEEIDGDGSRVERPGAGDHQSRPRRQRDRVAEPRREGSDGSDFFDEASAAPVAPARVAELCREGSDGSDFFDEASAAPVPLAPAALTPATPAAAAAGAGALDGPRGERPPSKRARRRERRLQLQAFNAGLAPFLAGGPRPPGQRRDPAPGRRRDVDAPRRRFAEGAEASTAARGGGRLRARAPP
ncbi:unnamed protein product [Prorocentrum cordatum]|uniref:Ribosome biogenesis protein NOP53 n=1 Tax=Prorocentrum cordatum TaxID=2364126 RepID=A0ABN9WAV1_9DINO|nr:unnamed protein product [Polarella glacialis]